MDAKISSQNQNNELQVSTTIYHQFKLPNDWVVVRRCRSKRGNRRSHNDKYHHEPGTGQRICSMISTQKHLSGETSKSAKPGNKKNIQIDPYIFKSCSLFDLPNGWIVEKKPRKNMECAGIIDKNHEKCYFVVQHYFEPETGKRSRSLRSVEKYLTEGKEHIATLEALKAGDNFIVSKV
ncbi:methyl-CpG-binding domain-containing protein 7 isoform X1 [Populus alba x Populus x berolinensis]|nr:methyl-CpG-binding domain-containing protein 7 isoform X1 [Populus alba x Populus x berolinensis]